MYVYIRVHIYMIFRSTGQTKIPQARAQKFGRSLPPAILDYMVQAVGLVNLTRNRHLLSRSVRATDTPMQAE